MTRIRNFYFRLSRWHEESIAQTPSYCHVVLTQRPIIHYRVSVQRLLRMKVALPRQYTNIALGYVMLISTSTNAQYEQHRNTNKTKPQNPIRPSHTLFATNITRHTRHWTTHCAAPLFAACLFFFFSYQVKRIEIMIITFYSKLKVKLEKIYIVGTGQ